MPSLAHTLIGLKPQPYGGELIRLGGDRDGAYLVPNDLAGISMCISPGASDTKLFEDELWDRYQIPSLLIDRSSSPDGFTTPMRPGQTLIQKWLEPRDSAESISLASALAHPGVQASKPDYMLQIDIEGGEYLAITPAIQDLLRAFRIIVIEFHNLGDLLRPWSRWHRRIKDTIEVLNRHHACVHAHPNNCCREFVIPGTRINLPEVLECTYLRRDRPGLPLSTHDAPRSPAAARGALPHPLDIANLPAKPPLILDRSWSAPDAAFHSLLGPRGPRLRYYVKQFFKNVISRIRRGV